MFERLMDTWVWARVVVLEWFVLYSNLNYVGG